MWSNWNPCTLLVGISNGVPSLEKSMTISQIIKNGTVIWSSNPTFGYMSKRTEIRISKSCLNSHLHCGIIHNSRNVKTTNMPIKEWMDNKNVIYTHAHPLWNIIQPLKVRKPPPYATTWMNREDINVKWNKQITEG